MGDGDEAWFGGWICDSVRRLIEVCVGRMLVKNGRMAVNGGRMVTTDKAWCCCGGTEPDTCCISWDLFNTAPANTTPQERAKHATLLASVPQTASLQLICTYSWASLGGPQSGDIVSARLSPDGVSLPTLIQLTATSYVDGGGCCRLQSYTATCFMVLERYTGANIVKPCNVSVYMASNGWQVTVRMDDPEWACNVSRVSTTPPDSVVGVGNTNAVITFPAGTAGIGRSLGSATPSGTFSISVENASVGLVDIPAGCSTYSPKVSVNTTPETYSFTDGTTRPFGDGCSIASYTAPANYRVEATHTVNTSETNSEGQNDVSALNQNYVFEIRNIRLPGESLYTEISWTSTGTGRWSNPGLGVPTWLIGSHLLMMTKAMAWQTYRRIPQAEGAYTFPNPPPIPFITKTYTASSCGMTAKVIRSQAFPTDNFSTEESSWSSRKTSASRVFDATYRLSGGNGIGFTYLRTDVENWTLTITPLGGPECAPPTPPIQSASVIPNLIDIRKMIEAL